MKLTNKAFNKTIQFELKQDVIEAGTIEGTLINHSVVDSYGDVFSKASIDSLDKSKQYFLLHMHDWSKELGTMTVEQDDNGNLKFVGKLDLSTFENGTPINAEAHKVYSLMKQGMNYEMSAGGYYKKAEFADFNTGTSTIRAFIIDEFDLAEGSLVIKGAVPGAGVETIKQNKKGEEKMTNEVEVAKTDATQTEDTATKTNDEVIDEVIGAVQTAVEGVATELKAPKEDKPADQPTDAPAGDMAKFRKQIEEDIMNKMNSEIRKNVKIENNVTKTDEATATFTKYLRGEQADFTKLDRTKTGALIPELKSKEILKEIKDGSVFFGASTVVSGTSNEYKFVVRKDDRANNVEGVTEGAGNTLDGELEFTQISFGAETLQGRFPVTDEALADSGYNLLDEITGATAEDFAEKLGQLITKGVKSSTNAIAGFLNDPSTISQVTANAGAFNQNDLIRLTRNKGMKSKYRKNAKLYVSPSAYTEMETWVDGNGRPLLTPTLTADNNIVSKFKGYEIVEEEYLEDVKTGKFPVFFGDFKSFYGMFVRINTFETEKERRANQRINIFYTRCRMGGGVIRPKAGVVLQVK